jgi:CBS domain-containing protein
MTSAELITNHILPLEFTNTAGQAVEIMHEHHVNELSVVNKNKFYGILRLEDIEDLLEDTSIADCVPLLKTTLVRPADFFLVALKKMHEQKLTSLPVVNEEGTLLGIIAEEELLQAVSHYNAASQPGGVIILQVHPNNFSISEIGRIVESNDAKIIHLNTWTDASSGQLMVAVKMNKSDIHDVLASFERYQYNVIQYFGENLTEDELKDNYEHLMNYLNI